MHGNERDRALFHSIRPCFTSETGRAVERDRDTIRAQSLSAVIRSLTSIRYLTDASTGVHLLAALSTSAFSLPPLLRGSDVRILSLCGECNWKKLSDRIREIGCLRRKM